MRTSANPLLRFYPPDDFDTEDTLEEQFMDDMINDAPLYDGTDKRDVGMPSPLAAIASSHNKKHLSAIVCALLIRLLTNFHVLNLYT